MNQFDLSSSSDAETVAILFDEISDSVSETGSEFALVSDNGGSTEEFASTQQLEQWLSHLLRSGVLSAGAIVLVGGILYLIRHGAEEAANYHFFQEEPIMFRSPTGVITAVLSGSSRGIIQLGLLLLIATPIARVAVSLLTFLSQRDFTYVFVTGLVLTGLIYSFVGAYL